jgi:uncharacterized protein YbjT (DUF2867 family)
MRAAFQVQHLDHSASGLDSRGVGDWQQERSRSPATSTVARAVGYLDALLSLSQMTVSQMNALSMSESHHQRMHWLSEQVLNWSGLPVIHVRPTLFLDNPLFTTVAARSIADSGTIRLPFGTGRTSPIAVNDVARVVSTILTDPGPYTGRVLELTGPSSQDMNGVAEEYAVR